MKNRLPVKVSRQDFSSGLHLRNYNIPESRSSHIEEPNLQRRKDSLSAYNKALLQQIQSLNNSLPLMKIDFEKMELELSDIRVSLKKDAAKSFQRDASPSLRTFQQRSGQIPPRGSSGVRQPEPQTATLDKIYHLERSMEKFKAAFIRRESGIMELVTGATEANLVAQRSVETTEGPSHGSQAGDNETDTKPILYNRIQELQRLNNELLGELRTANKKLLSVKFDRDQGESGPDPGRVWAHPAAQRRGYSQPREMDADAEKRQLNAKLIILNKELEKSNQAHEEKVIEIKTEYRKKLDMYLAKLASASSSVNRFLVAMQKLQVGVVNRDEYNMERLRNEFEAQKAQLVNLAKDLKVFDDSSKKETVRRVNLSSVKIGKRGRLTMDETKKLEEEMLNLKKEHEKTIIEKAQLESLVETLKKTTRQRPQSSQRPHESKDSQGVLAHHRASEQQLKRRIAELEDAVRERGRTLQQLGKSSGAALKARLMPLVSKAEKRVLTKLSELDYRATVQIENVERLQALAAKLLEEGFALQSKQGEDNLEYKKLKTEYEARAKRLTELEKRMGSLNSTMKEEYKGVEKENKELKEKLREMEGAIEENNKKVATLTTAKDVVVKKSKAKIEELGTRLKTALQNLKSSEERANSARQDAIDVVNLLGKPLNKMAGDYRNIMQIKLDELSQRIGGLNDSISARETMVREHSAKKPKKAQDNKKLLTNIVGRMNKLFQVNSGELQKAIKKQNERIFSCNNGLKKLLIRTQSLKLEEENLLEQLANEKSKVESLNLIATELEFDAKEALMNMSERAALKTRDICKSCIEKIKIQDKDLSSLRSLVGRLQGGYMKQRKEAETLRGENEDLASKLLNQQEMLKELQESIATMDENTNKLREQLQEKEKALAKLRAESQTAIDDLQLKLDEADGIIGQLRRENSERIESSLADKERIQEFSTRSKQLQERSEEEVNRLKLRLEDVEAENKQLEENILLKDKEFAENMSGKDEMIEKLMKIKDAADSTIAELKEQLETNTQISSQLSADKEQLMQSLNDKKNELMGKDEAIEELEAKNRALESTNRQLNETMEELKQSYDKILDNSRTEGESMKVLVTQQLSELNSEMLQAQSDLKEKDAILDELKNKHEQGSKKLNEELLRMQKEIEEKNKAKEDLEKEYKSEIEELSKNLAEAESTIKQLETTINELETEKDNTKAELDNNILQLEGDLKEKSKELSDLKTAYESTINDFNENISTANTNLQERQKRVDELEQENKDLLGKVAEAESSLKEREKQIAELQERQKAMIDELSTKLQTEESEKDKTIDYIKTEYRKIIDDLNNNLVASENKLKERESTINGLREQNAEGISNLEKKYEEQMSELKQKHEDDLAAKRNLINTLQEENNNMSREAENSLKMSNQAMEALKADYENKLREVTDKAAQEKDALNNEHDAMLNQVKEEVDRLEKELEEKSKDIEDLKNANGQQINDLNEQVHSLEETVERKDKIIESMQQSSEESAKSLNGELLKWREKFNESEEAVSKLKAQNEEQVNEFNIKILAAESNTQERSKAIDEMLESYKKKVEELNNDLAMKDNTLKDKDEIIEGLKEMHEQSTKKFKEQLSKAESDLQGRDKAAEEYSEEINKLREDIAERDNAITELQAQNEETANELSDKLETLKQLQERQKELEDKEMLYEDMIKQLNGELATLNKDLMERNQAIDSVNAAHEAQTTDLNKKIAELEEEIQKKQKQIDEAEDSRTKNESIISELNDRTAALQTQLEDKEATLHNTEAAKDQELAHALQLQVTLQAANSQLKADYDFRIEQLGKDLAESRSTSQEQEKTIGELKDKSEELKEVVEQRDERIKEMARLVEGSRAESGKELNELHAKLAGEKDVSRKCLKEIEELKGQVARLEEASAEDKEEIVNRNNIIKDLKVSYEDQFAKLKAELEEKGAEEKKEMEDRYSAIVKAKEDEMQSANKDLQDLKLEIEQFDHAIAEKNKDANELKQQHEEATKQLMEELEESNKAREELQAENEAQANDLSMKKEQLNTALKEIEDIKANYLQTEEANKKLVETLNKDKGLVDSLNKALTNCKNIIEDFVNAKFNSLEAKALSSVSELEGKLSRLANIVNGILGDYLSLRRVSGELKARFESSEEKCKELDTLAIELSSKMHKEQDLSSSLNDDLKAHKQRLREVLISMNERINSMVDEMNKKVLDSVNENSEKIKAIESALLNANIKQTEEFSSILEQLNEVVNENVALARKNNELVTQKDKLLRSILSVMNHKDTEAADELLLEKDDIIKDISEAIAELGMSEEYKQTIVEERRDLAKELVETVKEKAEIIGQKDEQFKKAFEDFVNSSQGKLDELEKTNKELLSKLEQAKGDENSFKLAMEATNQRHRKVVEEFAEKVNKDFESHTAVAISEVSKVQEKVDSLMNLLEQLQDKYVDAKETQESMVVEHKSQLDSFAQELLEKEKQLQDSLNEVKELKEQVSTLQEGKDELNSARGNQELLQSVKEMAERMSEENLAAQSKLNNSIENLQDKLLNMPSRLAILKDVQNASRKSIVETLHAKEQTILQLKARLEQLAQESAKQQEPAPSPQAALETIIEELNDKLIRKEEEHNVTMQGLTDKMMAIQMENAELRSQLEDAQEAAKSVSPASVKESPQKGQANLVNSLAKELNTQVNKLVEEQKKNKVLLNERQRVKELLKRLGTFEALPHHIMDRLSSLEKRLAKSVPILDAIQLSDLTIKNGKQVMRCRDMLEDMEGKMRTVASVMDTGEALERVVAKLEYLYKLLKSKEGGGQSESLAKMRKRYDDLMAANSEMRLRMQALEKANGELTDKMIAQSETGSVYSHSSGPKSESVARTQQPTKGHFEEEKKTYLVGHVKSLVVQIAEAVPIG